MESYILLVGIILVILLIVLFVLRRSRSTRPAQQDFNMLEREAQELRLNFARSEERVRHQDALIQGLKNELENERTRLLAALQEMERSQSYYRAQQERLEQQKQDLQQSHEKLSRDFELIAARILDEKSKKFTEQNSVNLSLLLNPLRENIKQFEEKVEKVYKAESDERNVLKGYIGQLLEQSNLMSQETRNLTRALKGDTKKQGNWGEVILERILERSGLVRDREYRVQAGMLSADGSRLQPDVIIDLPDQKNLIVDSKVSLTAYEKLLAAETPEETELCEKQHIVSIKTHINGLASKNYSDLYQINSPDFVLLFFPIESSFSLAVQKDAELFNYAWERRVVLVSPSTLLATLRTIAGMWKQERQTRNVMEIARLSGEMYDKFVGFVTDMEAIGKNIRQGHDLYDKAMNKLSQGRGNLTTTAEKIKRLGARTAKQLDPRLIENEED